MIPIKSIPLFYLKSRLTRANYFSKIELASTPLAFIIKSAGGKATTTAKQRECKTSNASYGLALVRKTLATVMSCIWQKCCMRA